MEINKKGVLLSVSESDLEGGVFYNDKIIEVGEGCFRGMKSLVKLILPKCTKITSSIRDNAALTTLSLPLCKEVVNSSIRDNAALTTLSLPVCEVVNYSIRDNAALTTLSLPVCEVVNSSIRDNAALTTLSLPLCKEVVNYSIRDNAALTTLSLPLCKEVVNYSIRDNAALTTLVIGKIKYNVKSVDRQLFVVENEKTTKGIKIYSGYNYISLKDKKVEKEICYVAEKESFYAHGETIKKAIEDVQFKIVSEKLKKEPINKDTVITINYYRLVTGACLQGVNSWISRTFNDKEKEEILENGIKAKDLLPILKANNAYGVERFQSLVTFK
jgi:hypothetical protein